MGLKDNYKKLAGGAPAAPPSAAPATTTATVASATPAASAPAPVQTTVAPPGVGGSRDLAAMRAKLAQRQTGGVNPPEAVAAVTPALLEPRTQETPDGGAEPLPSAADPGAATPGSASPAPATPVSPSGSEPSAAPELTRGQKAAATRAAKKAAAQAETPTASAGAAPSVGESATLSRIADALEALVLMEVIRSSVDKPGELESIMERTRKLAGL